MGYRWYDAQNIAPAFPFGHGLSYSTFQYSALSVTPPALTPSTPITVYATLCNTGGPGGEEVAQLYLGFPAAAGMPPKQLKGFQKVFLGAGACEGVGFPIDPKDVQVWDVVAQAWKWVPGTYSVWVGSSSRDIRLTGSFTI
jgi:beta-glucosidase